MLSEAPKTAAKNYLSFYYYSNLYITDEERHLHKSFHDAFCLKFTQCDEKIIRQEHNS